MHIQKFRGKRPKFQLINPQPLEQYGKNIDKANIKISVLSAYSVTTENQEDILPLQSNYDKNPFDAVEKLSNISTKNPNCILNIYTSTYLTILSDRENLENSKQKNLANLFAKELKLINHKQPLRLETDKTTLKLSDFLKIFNEDFYTELTENFPYGRLAFGNFKSGSIPIKPFWYLEAIRLGKIIESNQYSSLKYLCTLMKKTHSSLDNMTYVDYAYGTITTLDKNLRFLKPERNIKKLKINRNKIIENNNTTNEFTVNQSIITEDGVIDKSNVNMHLKVLQDAKLILASEVGLKFLQSQPQIKKDIWKIYDIDTFLNDVWNIVRGIVLAGHEMHFEIDENCSDELLRIYFKSNKSPHKK